VTQLAFWRVGRPTLRDQREDVREALHDRRGAPRVAPFCIADRAGFVNFFACETDFGEGRNIPPGNVSLFGDFSARRRIRRRGGAFAAASISSTSAGLVRGRHFEASAHHAAQLARLVFAPQLLPIIPFEQKNNLAVFTDRQKVRLPRSRPRAQINDRNAVVPKLREPLKFAANLNVVLRADKPQRRIARSFKSLLTFGSREPSHVCLP
jgi:hypothetical protein